MITEQQLREIGEKLAEEFAYKHWPEAESWQLRSGAIAGYLAGRSSLVTPLIEALEALEYISIRLQYERHTLMSPLYVRELDGSVSQQKQKSNAGEAYHKARTCLAKITQSLSTEKEQARSSMPPSAPEGEGDE